MSRPLGTTIGIELAFSPGLMYFIFEFLACDIQILLPTMPDGTKAQTAKGKGALIVVSAICPHTHGVMDENKVDKR